MATILLSTAGAAIGGGFGGSFLGVSGAAIGRTIGATVGRAIDQRLLGSGSKAVGTGQIDRLRLQSAGEGVPLPRIWGQMRVPGHVIWASPLEVVRDGGGAGKGAPRLKPAPISYRLSVALALCEGRIAGVGRVWADGEEVAASDMNMRVYPGDGAQMPDPAIAAHEGEDAPACRDTAYVVLEDLDLSRWGNRLPQLSFEVTRPAQVGSALSGDLRAVAMIPGTGEYALATTPVTLDLGVGERLSANVNTPMGGTDFSASLDVLGRELPKVAAVSLVVSWFGDDLRTGHCSLKPRVENKRHDGEEMPWRVGGVDRAGAGEVPRVGGRSIYGGTPADASVTEALRAIRATGREAVFYPFVLMEQLNGNGLPDPYGRDEQPVMPWRGRITASTGSDGTEAAEREVTAFFGQAGPEDFRRDGESIVYRGPDEWSYRRFILHYAHLCAAAGGVDAFLIGSEMAGMTRIRGVTGYPAVAALRRLAADVRLILGPSVKISYAADWSEYFGHHPGGGELFFHLDPLWADGNIDFIGIDNYMPMTDWRDGSGHLDAHWGRIDNPDYLRAGIGGGEGFDWYYATQADRDAQKRTPITDGAYDEAWVWRYKDLRGWWRNLHFDRPGGIRAASPTEWIPESKPIWFTEIGCAAIDKATNQPNKFLDLMSSESSLPYYSDGGRDDGLQAACLQAVMGYWCDPGNNPVSVAGVRMVDVGHAHVWCWDARPYPAFPGRRDLWSDGPAWERGHWLNGRAGAVPLALVVGDICREAGVPAFDVSDLSGLVRGYRLQGDETGRAALQPLMLTYGFDAVERDGILRFIMRGGAARAEIGAEDLALTDGLGGIEKSRASVGEAVGRVRLTHVEAGGDYGTATAEAILPDAVSQAAAGSECALVLTRSEGQAVAGRWLAEAQLSQDMVRFALPPSGSGLGPGDVVRIGQPQHSQHWRIDRIERAGALTFDAVRVEPGIYRRAEVVADVPAIRRHVPPLPVWPVFLDLPLMRGDEAPHAPYLAVAAEPWPGSVAAYLSAEAEGGFVLNRSVERQAVIGRTLTPLHRARAGVIDRAAPLRIHVKGDRLRAVGMRSLLAGANLMAIGNGAGEWELMQFAGANPIGGDVWEIHDRLRGQAGTDGVMPETWPEGSVVVLMDGAPLQVDLPPSVLGQERFWRIGPAARGPDDASYRDAKTELPGVGLRPYSPCHLTVDGRMVRWVRRTRIGGDGWEQPEVPLGEAGEAYLLRLIGRGKVLHEAQMAAPEYLVPEAAWSAAMDGGPFTVAVAQLSDLFGAGPFVRREVNGSE